MRFKQAIYESTRALLTRSPFPDGEGKKVRCFASVFYKGRCPEVVYESLEVPNP